ECLSEALQHAREHPDEGSKPRDSSVPPAPVAPTGRGISVSIVRDLDDATQEALRVAHNLLDGPGCARLPTLTTAGAAGRRGAKEVDEREHDPNSQRLFSLDDMGQAMAGSLWQPFGGVPFSSGLLQEQVGGAVPSRDALSDKERLKQ
ncbi:unnamed protein product, partial [Polarella glacialis]